jgi:hypothetical protein
MCDGRQKGGPIGEHGTSGTPCRIAMPMPMGGPGSRLQKNMGGGGGAKPTLSVPVPSVRRRYGAASALLHAALRAWFLLCSAISSRLRSGMRGEAGGAGAAPLIRSSCRPCAKWQRVP